MKLHYENRRANNGKTLCGVPFNDVRDNAWSSNLETCQRCADRRHAESEANANRAQREVSK